MFEYEDDLQFEIEDLKKENKQLRNRLRMVEAMKNQLLQKLTETKLESDKTFLTFCQVDIIRNPEKLNDDALVGTG